MLSHEFESIELRGGGSLGPRRTRSKKVKSKGRNLPPEQVDKLATALSKQIDAEIWERKTAPVREVLFLVGTGAFLAASVAIPNLPKALGPLLFKDSDDRDAFKRFNIPRLKQTLKRLERQKLVEINLNDDGCHEIKITEAGRQKVLRYALDELAIKKPKNWNGQWHLVSYDVPEDLKPIRNSLNDYFKAWGFYPLHKSVYLHAYPVEEAVEFLREFLGVGECVRILTVTKIEDDKVFREFFGV